MEFVDDLLIFIHFRVKLEMKVCIAAYLNKHPEVFPLDVTFKLLAIYL